MKDDDKLIYSYTGDKELIYTHDKSISGPPVLSVAWFIFAET